MTLSTELERIFDADRMLRSAERKLLEQPSSKPLIALLEAATQEALQMADRSEATMRLERLADLCAQVPGPKMTDAMIAILNDPEPRVRVAAGEALTDVAYERYAEVARGIERALDAGLSGPAMAELPWILAEVAEPSALLLIRRFLQHSDPDVIAAAIESLVQLGDPAGIEDLSRFVDDGRPVIIDDFEEETRTSLGELARDALALLGGGPGEDS